MENVPIVVGETIPAIADDTLITIAEQAEKRLEAMRKIKLVALALTNRQDWVNENGKPYLQSTGSEKIARMFGVSWQIEEPAREVFPDGHYEWSYKGHFHLSGSSITAIGARSSRDKFFSRRGGNDLPPSEVDSSNVKKAAYTNMLANGITRLLGLRNLTWEDLSQYAKIRKEEVQGVEYKKKSESSGSYPDGKEISEAQRKKIWAMMMEKKLTKEQAKQFYDSVNPKTSKEASDFIEHFDKLLGAFQERSKGPLPDPDEMIRCPDMGEIKKDTCKDCKKREGCPAYE